MKILLLEDDKLLNDSISKFLSIKGHAVTSFRDGELALDAITGSCYDLLILDINVPNISGLTLLEILNEGKIHISTIFISAVIDIDDISRAFDLGCHDYLKKPFHLKELEIRISKLLQSEYIPTSHLRLSRSYSLDMESLILRFNGDVHIISDRHLKMLSLLARNRNRVVNYTLFQEYAWDDLDVAVPTIRAEMNRLKNILKEDIIINIRNMGYMIKRPI